MALHGNDLHDIAWHGLRGGTPLHGGNPHGVPSGLRRQHLQLVRAQRHELLNHAHAGLAHGHALAVHQLRRARGVVVLARLQQPQHLLCADRAAQLQLAIRPFHRAQHGLAKLRAGANLVPGTHARLPLWRGHHAVKTAGQPQHLCRRPRPQHPEARRHCKPTAGDLRASFQLQASTGWKAHDQQPGVNVRGDHLVWTVWAHPVAHHVQQPIML
mmetsp:Transcript_125290/g.297355  ORF Transcript_125290/g.297355 Transcript_125290/m.297355 type:complete len:214 (-) Transcript_125290:596-1237(-)